MRARTTTPGWVGFTLVLTLLACSSSLEPTATVPFVELTVIAVTDTPPGPQPASESSDASCDFDLFPTDAGTSWEYLGSDSTESSYSRTDLVTDSGDEGFTVISTFSDMSLRVEYGCTEEGLVQFDPAQSWGAFAVGPNGGAVLQTLDQSGLSLPSEWFPGFSWPQFVEWQAVGEGGTTHGEYTFTHTAVGEESVTVPYGSFDAMFVRTDLTAVLNGQSVPPCQISTWWVEDVGMAKQVFDCGGGLNNSIELVDFDAP